MIIELFFFESSFIERSVLCALNLTLLSFIYLQWNGEASELPPRDPLETVSHLSFSLV